MADLPGHQNMSEQNPRAVLLGIGPRKPPICRSDSRAELADVRKSEIDRASPLSRRRWLASGLGLGAGLSAMAASNLWLPRAIAETQTAGKGATEHSLTNQGLLVRPAGISSMSTRTKVVLEVEGELRLEDPDPNKREAFRRGEVKAKSTLDYFEKTAYADSAVVGAARHYTEAQAESWISGRATKQSLRPACRETRMFEHDATWQQYCPLESLDAREIELLESPVNSAALELLLPTEPAKPTTTWTISKQDAKHIFNLEAVHDSDLTARVAKVEKGVATIELSGELTATANSVPTRLKINGNYNAEFNGACAMVSWLGLLIKEDREISEAKPGFSVTAKVRLIRASTKDRLEITEDDLRALAAKADRARWLVRLNSKAGQFSMLADRNWRIYFDTGEETILRMIDDDTVIAQCNVSRLPKLEEGSQLTLEAMQAEIRQSLGKKFEQFLQSSEKVTSHGLRLLRCVVVGSAEEVPVQWIYNHLSDDAGRRIALIFAMGGNLTDRFAAADEQMTSSFELLTDQSPTAAPKSGSGAEPGAKISARGNGSISR